MTKLNKSKSFEELRRKRTASKRALNVEECLDKKVYVNFAF